jgi:hypothetical protein
VFENFVFEPDEHHDDRSPTASDGKTASGPPAYDAGMTERKSRHEAAQRWHEDSADRHDTSAKRWSARGEPERAELDRRHADIERDAAKLAGDRARVERERPLHP